ncbi:MAG: hypothetical protein ACLT9W_03265 [Streptococcus sp.]
MVSGGQGADELTSEAEAGKNYLMEQGYQRMLFIENQFSNDF